MRELTVRRGPNHFAVRRFGRRGPHLVMIHGLASTQHIWDLVIPRLEKRFRITTFDQRGHGESSKPSSGYSFDEVCKDLAAVLRAAGARKPLLMGHSYGANVAIDFAARHPSALVGLISVDGGMGSMSEVMDWPTARKTLAPPQLGGMTIDEVLAVIRDGPLAQVWSSKVETIKRTLFEVNGAGRARIRLARANHFRILRAMYDQRPKELLAAIRVPTLMYCARPRARVMDEERDFYEMKRDSARRIRGANRNVKIEWITSVHDIPLDRPRELAARVSRFAREVSR